MAGHGDASFRWLGRGASAEHTLLLQSRVNGVYVLEARKLVDALAPFLAPRVLPATRAELQGLKPSALQRRAKESGVPSEQIDEAVDSDTPKDALLRLLLNATSAPAAAAGDASDRALELVFLNGCCTAELAQALAMTSEALQEPRAPCVLCWASPTLDFAARRFAAAFYSKLAQAATAGRPLDAAATATAFDKAKSDIELDEDGHLTFADPLS